MTERERDNALLAAALLAQTGAADGPPPSDDELREWSEQRLDGPRKTQVESHLAHDPRALERFVQHSRPGAGHAAQRRRRLPLVLAAAAAAVAVAVTVQLSLRNNPGKGPPPEELVLREARAVHPDWRVESFRRGLQGQGSGHADAPPPLVIEQCLDGGARCVEHGVTLLDFGGWVARMDDACAADRAFGDLDTERAALSGISQRMNGSLELAAWYADVQTLAVALDAGPTAVCEAAARLRRARVD